MSSSAKGAFDELWYLEAYPDVWTAMEQGFISSGEEHYLRFGKNEGRTLGVSHDPTKAKLLHLKDQDGPSTIPAKRIERTVTDEAQCAFYHVVELEDGTVTEGQWDLRPGFDDYVGHFDFQGKSVLEIGPASGYLSFEMERRGAEVTAIEPPLTTLWDYVPRPTVKAKQFEREFRGHIEQVRNGFWFLHNQKKSKVRLLEADAYNLPSDLGRFDVGLLGSVLLHCSSPVEMIASMARRVNDTIIICELFAGDLVGPTCRLVPSPGNDAMDTWWQFSPEFFVDYLGVLGFGDARVTRHVQSLPFTNHATPLNRRLDMFTVTAHRG